MNWKEIKKKFKSLKCPPEYINPCKIDYDKSNYIVLMSDRQRGKTTQVLLLGLCANIIDGAIIHYVRQSEEMIMPNKIQNLFSAIVENGYIEKITNGEYNNVIYKSRRWYYTKVNENGIIEKQDNKYFCFCMDVDDSELYKSSYTCPYPAFIVYDEFISKRYYPNEFINYMDIVKTILGNKTNGIIFMLSNTLNPYNQYFSELCINDIVENMHMGEYTYTITDLGTPIYIEILESVYNQKNNIKENINRLFFGFNNPKMASITGLDTWALLKYPHLQKDETKRVLLNNIYVLHGGRLARLQMCSSELLGIYINCYFVDNYKQDAIVFTSGDIDNINKRYGFGSGRFDQFIWKLYLQNKFYYANNSVGCFIDNYVLYMKRNHK